MHILFIARIAFGLLQLSLIYTFSPFHHFLSSPPPPQDRTKGRGSSNSSNKTERKKKITLPNIANRHEYDGYKQETGAKRKQKTKNIEMGGLNIVVNGQAGSEYKDSK